MSSSIATVITDKLTELNTLATQINTLAVQLKKNESTLTSSVNSAVSLIRQLRSKEGNESLSDPEFRTKVTAELEKLEKELQEISDSFKKSPNTDEVKETVQSLNDLLAPVKKPEDKTGNDKGIVEKAEKEGESLMDMLKNTIGMGDDDAKPKTPEEVVADATTGVSSSTDDASATAPVADPVAAPAPDATSGFGDLKQPETDSDSDIVPPGKGTLNGGQRGGYTYSNRPSSKMSRKKTYTIKRNSFTDSYKKKRKSKRKSGSKRKSRRKSRSRRKSNRTKKYSEINTN